MTRLSYAALCILTIPISIKRCVRAQRYTLLEPAGYDEAFNAQSQFDSQRSVRECFCGESKHRGLWVQFLDSLQEGLKTDPSFQGNWVHDLCSFAYPVIFKVVSIHPEDDSLTMHTDCPAGILAMVLVCAQSSSLQHQQGGPTVITDRNASHSGESDAQHAAAPENLNEVIKRSSGLWKSTVRVVADEGDSAGDVFEAIPLEKCLDLCELEPKCNSLAFGPHGCHLKTRCVRVGDPVVPMGEQGADYKTYFREVCVQEPKDLDTSEDTKNTYLQELQNMMVFAIRTLEFCFHCLDASPWPFLLSEVLENYALAVEGPEEFVWQRAAGRVVGPSTWAGSDGSESEQPPPLNLQGETLTTLSTPSRLRQTLLRLQVRWTRGLEMEAEFWRKKLSLNPDENNSLQRLRQWLATGDVTWFLDGDDLCGFVADVLARSTATSDTPSRRHMPRVLNTGSGPFAPGPMRCVLPEAHVGKDSFSPNAEKVIPWEAHVGKDSFSPNAEKVIPWEAVYIPPVVHVLSPRVEVKVDQPHSRSVHDSTDTPPDSEALQV